MARCRSVLSLCLVVVTVCFVSSQDLSQIGDFECAVAKCAQPLVCGQFEQCLLEAEKDGCSRAIIRLSSTGPYKQCLFGDDGFCSMVPLIDCYNTHLLPHIKTPLPKSSVLEPQDFAGILESILSPSFYLNITCSLIQVSEIRAMSQCVLRVAATMELNCPTSMLIATKRYFSRTQAKESVNPSIIQVLETLSTYASICSNFGEYSDWINNQHPRSANDNDVETVPQDICGGQRPLSFECGVDPAVSQGCGLNGCSTVQQYSCRINGSECLARNQGLSNQDLPCPCCDYRVRVRCPVFAPVDIYPTYGPVMGGTNLTVVGGPLGLIGTINTRIYIGSTFCPVISRNRTQIVCRVPPPATSDPLNRVVQNNIVSPVRIERGQNFQPANVSFTYMASPAIIRLYNLNTLVSGGTNVTIEGTNLLSVAEPRMIIDVVYKVGSKTDIWTFVSVCTAVSNEQLECPVPALINPIAFTPNTTTTTPPQFPGVLIPVTPSTTITGFNLQARRRRRRRSAPVQHADAHSRGRHKRQVCSVDGTAEEPINDNENLTYYVRIDLGGGFGSERETMNVFIDPRLEVFAETPSCRVYRRWALFEQTELELLGERLSNGLNCYHYNVRVGSAVCEMKNLFSNRLVCTPPGEEPALAAEDVDGLIGVEVRVGNGNLKFRVGCLDYTAVFLDDPTARYGFIAGLVFLIVIIILIAICCCYQCAQKRKKPKKIVPR